MGHVGTIINFCTSDAKFIGHCIRAAADATDAVVVSHADHLFDGTPEDLGRIRRIAEQNPRARFVSFPYFHPITESLGPRFWHNFARWTGLQHLPGDVDHVLFLDADEIMDAPQFRAFLALGDYRRYDYLFFADYWYFREPRYRATRLEDSPLMVRRDVLNKNLMFHDNERKVFLALPNGARRVGGPAGTAMFHHYSWVRSREEMLRKVSTWGHRGETDWAAMVAEEFSRPFSGTDFVHGYRYETVTPFIQLTADPAVDTGTGRPMPGADRHQ